MPGLTIATDAAARPAPTAPAPAPAPTPASTNPRRASASSARTSSPPRPPVSPITPPLAAIQLPGPDPPPAVPDFSRGRPTFTHTTQPDQRHQPQPAPPLPPAAPIDFDANPDVLALKSAISILQLQRARAAADIQQLSRAKAAALADPEAFVADLEAGRVQVGGGGDPMFGRGVGDEGEGDDESDENADEDEDVEEGEDEGEVAGPQETTHDSRATAGTGARSSDGDVAMGGNTGTETLSKPQTKPAKAKPKRKKQATTTTQPPPWQKLPKPQNIVRCPPINWAQYGVVGESLDKLHAEQIAAPTPGAPLVLGPGGTYEFTAGSGEQATTTPSSGGTEARRLVGVAAPYNPLRDKIDKKGKGGRR